MVEDSAPRPAYLFQLARAGRFHGRLGQLVPDDFEHGDELNEYEDNLHACFVMCWHVKDWVQSDPQLPAHVRQQVVAEAHASPALMLCRDVANGVKHLEVRDNRTGVVGTAAVVSSAADGTRVWKHYLELPDGELAYAPMAAQAALVAWREILERHGLPLPEAYPV